MTQYKPCSPQELNTMKDSIFDAVREWQTTCNSAPEYGLAINPDTLEVEFTTAAQAHSSQEWFPLTGLIEDGKPSADAILDLVDRFCFVR